MSLVIFVMAATLMYIKTRMLLPQQDQGINEEAEIDPRWELVQQLIAYRKFKEAAEGLQKLIFSSCQLIAGIALAQSTVRTSGIASSQY